ncbi:MAG: T9SS type A sorting domain-containing protein, partial [Candidatus Kapaibacteriota bacterium]
GMGEVGFPSVIPALCNAIYNAIGLRIRKLPIGKTPLLKSEDNKNDFEKFRFNSYPNPFVSEVLVEVILNDLNKPNLQLIIYDFLGKEVLKPKLNNIGNKFYSELNFENYPPGVYYAVVCFDNKRRSFPLIKTI